VSLANRLVAKAIDLFLIFLFSVILPHPLGVLLGLFYVLVHDGLPKGQSLGKKLLKLKVVRMDGALQKPCDFSRSCIRNAPLGLPTFFAIIPFWGWFLAILLGIPMIFIEVYLLMKREKGQRLGDVMADTFVVSENS